MKQYRFGLCPNLDACLIAKIEKKANGGSENDALRQMIRFWQEQEERQNVTPERQNNITERANNDSEVTSQEISLSSLDVAFKDM